MLNTYEKPLHYISELFLAYIHKQQAPTKWRDSNLRLRLRKGKSQGDNIMTVAPHIRFCGSDKWKFPQPGPCFKLTSVSSSRSNYLDLHLETGKGKRFLCYASLGYRISNTIQMSLKGLMIELQIATICSNWKYDHHFLWSSDLGMSRGHSVTVSKEAAGERWNHPEVGCYQFVLHFFPISHFPESRSHRAALLFMGVLVQFRYYLLSSKLFS